MKELLWHAEALPAVFENLRTSEAGLRAEDAARRLREDGPNALPEAKPDGFAAIFLRQFRSPLIYVLFAASAAVFFLGEVADGTIILAVLLFNAIVGAVQEGRAQNTLRALKHYVETPATVVRGGVETVIPDAEVVRGDIIVLREGERVPADARIIDARALKLDEAALTGESEPVGKTVDTLDGRELPVAERKNMVFKGTAVVVGAGRAVVVATGEGTAIGSIARAVSALDADLPLKKDIRDLSRAIIFVTAAVSVALFLLGLARGESVATIFATVVSLAVSVIPEGLPIVITIVLATGVWRMSRRNALVKRLQAVEALGQARVIAVDKTGTITKNELVVREVWTEGKAFTIGGVGYEPKGNVSLGDAVVDAANHPELLFVGKLSALGASARVFFSEAEQRWRVAGDPTEAALRVFGEKIGFKKDDLARECPTVAELPFDYRFKYHATTCGTGEDGLLVVSGAPEAVLALSTHVRRAGRDRPLNAVERKELEDTFADMSERGLRVVALAARARFSGVLAPEAVHDLSFVALLGMQDAMRLEAADAVKRASAAGVRVVMITGDHALTARAVARDAGIWKEGDELLSGAAIDGMSDAELAERVATVSVFARVAPEHKLRIVSAYKRRGEIVAMTGDGVNDAPSLVAADLGVAMGKIGTEVAKEAADIVLLDDDFGSIVYAIEEGRNIYRTVKKVILYLFSTSLGEALTITLALALGYPLPLLAAQIIWLNFVTDGFLDVALAMEPKERGLLSGAFARSQRRLVDSHMARRMVVMALPMAIGTLFLFQRYASADIEKAWTISLTTLAVFQWFNAWNCRSEKASLFRTNVFSNPYLLAATVLIVLLHLCAVYVPFFQRFLHTVPLAPSDWFAILPVAASIIAVEEVRKFFARRRRAERSAKSRAILPA